MRRAILFLALSLGAQTIIINTGADMTGDGSAHALRSASTLVRWFQIEALSTNTAHARVGDSNTSSTRGIDLAPGAAMYFAENTRSQPWDLATVYYYAANGDKLQLSYANYKSPGDQ